MSIERDCAVCGNDVVDAENSVRDYYELSHHYFERDQAGFTKLVAPGTGGTLYFCSARCLCTYVDGRIRPDADTEGPSE